MIDPPTAMAGSPERKIELDQTVDYAVQLLLEEAHMLGWQRVKFLTTVMDAANNQLSAMEEERELEEVPPAREIDKSCGYLGLIPSCDQGLPDQ